MDLRSKIPFLEEFPLENLVGAKLPTKRDIFRHFCHNKRNGRKQKDAVREGCSSLLDQRGSRGEGNQECNQRYKFLVGRLQG